MASEFIVVGRRELPPGNEPWQLELQNNEGGVSICEAAVRFDDAGRASVSSQAAEVVGWTPRSIVFVRNAWDLAQVVAEELATALEGAVFCDADYAVFFDAFGKPAIAGSRRELEERLARAFNDPQPVFDRWQAQEKARFEAEREHVPSAAAADDWSDVE